MKEFLEKISYEVKWTDIVAAFVVIYSAILSTVVFIRQINGDKPKAKVEFLFGTITGYGEFEKFEIRPFINFYNIGNNKIKIVECAIDVPNKNHITFVNKYVELPQIIEPGDSFKIWTDGERLKTELIRLGYNDKLKIKAYVRDAVGKKYYSKSFKFSLEKKFK